MSIEKHSAWFEVHAAPDTVGETAWRIEPKEGGDFTITASIDSAIIIVECSATSLVEVLELLSD